MVLKRLRNPPGPRRGRYSRLARMLRLPCSRGHSDHHRRRGLRECEARRARARDRRHGGEERGARAARRAARASARARSCEANAADLADERAAGLTDALRDRLTLDEARIEAMAEGVREIAALPDPVGEVVEERTLASGLEMRKVRVPLGVVAVVYEARPNVTVDCAALCIKSRQRDRAAGVELRGALQRGSRRAGQGCRSRRRASPADAVALLGGDRSELAELAGAEGLVDLIIPRGGEGLKEALKEVAKVPVMYAASGNCHVYVHEDADLEMARADRLQREGPAARGLQRGGDAASELRRRRAAAARRARRPGGRRRRAGRRRAGARELGRGRRLARRARTTGARSTLG